MTIPLLAYAIGHWEGYKPAEHHRLIADKLHDVADGKCKRLMIFMPPRHGKSMLASEYFPSWYLGQHPDHYVIAATYAQGLADDFGRKVRNLIASDVYKSLFPGGLSEDSHAASRLHTVKGGAYFAVGAGGPITGRGAHLLLIDDPIKGREDADSAVMRNRLKEWYTSVARTRLMPGGAIVVIQTRWHEDDLAGWLLREHAHEGWEVLNLPALAEPNDPLGRAEGEALWPESYPVDELSTIRRSIGDRDWSALYQQRPSAAEGSIFKRQHWQYYEPIEVAPRALLESLKIYNVIQAWDTAFKAKETSDYSAGVTIGVSDTRYYVLDVWRHRLEYPELKDAIKAQANKWGVTSILIEDGASGQSLIQDLQRSTRLPIVPVKADRDKVSRAHAVTPTHAASLCYLPNNAHWVSDFVDELAAFPSAPHDDQVDAFVHALTWAKTCIGPKPELEEEDDFDGYPRASGWLA